MSPAAWWRDELAPQWQSAGLDLTKPSPARMYDYYLGGKDNFEADRVAVQEMHQVIPELFQTARENRAFLGRAVRYVAGQGIRQFIDLGTGLPTQGNVHEIAQQVSREARVVYVDHDPVVATHGRALLAEDGSTTIIERDIRDPDKVLEHPALQKLVDLREPVAVLFVAVLHFISDAEHAARIVQRFREAMAPGSYLVIAHGTRAAGATAVSKMTQTYDTATEQVSLRDPAEIARFFEGFDLLEPGAVHLPWWRPEIEPHPEPDPTKWHFGGVALRPAD
ncbi:SAM-dependent methyltransferase [Actinomadura rugatobispora]|uniref:SAM-dependent methyltransferase n=1 Tax=Actinomadura rugatobispora TaxID=1994 RepID=A0ABW1A7L9_9ACTN|nr:SAM-dependent methyltransferase [Actinomadura rugatobispora]